VLLLDLDLRRPALAALFGLEGAPGLTDVAAGRAELDDAVAPIAVGPQPTGRGSLEVVPLGPIPADPGEFAVAPALPALLERLRARADLLLVDAPPLLQVGDALALGALVDAVVVVTRLHALQRATLGELVHALDACPATKLGFVVTAADEDDGYAEPYRSARASYSSHDADSWRAPAPR
jgi:Mrp family chromosome partitioning ATPase